MCEPPAGITPQLHFTQAELGVLGSDADVHALQEFQATGDTKAIHSSDDGLEDVLERTFGRIVIAHLVAGSDGRQRILDVHAGAKSLVASTGDDGHPQVRVGVEIIESSVHADQHLARERVHRHRHG
jgi:hypothetical protein